MKKFYLISIILFYLASFSYAQENVAINGTIVDTEGEPLIGANIRIKGTTNGTVCDYEGKFTINLEDENTILIISSIGYQTQEVNAKNVNQQTITLHEDVKTMEEVVVVGYGKQERKDITGSVSTVGSDEILKQPTLTATQAIQGKVAGVQITNNGGPGSTPMVRIRGVGSMLAGADPLYVVDGVITDNIQNINSSDIKTMDILKDASATAIYGVRAANGVVLITTKAGEKGKMKISYDMMAGAKTLLNPVQMADAEGYMAYSNEALIRNGDDPRFTDPAKYNTNWFDEVTRTGFQTSHNLSLNGGGDKSTYFLSVGYFDEKGLLQGDDFKRLNLRLNNTYQVAKRVKVGMNMGLSSIDREVKPARTFNSAYTSSPLVPVYDEDGNWGNANEIAGSNIMHPVAQLEYHNENNLAMQLQGAFFAEVELSKSLQFKSSLGVDRSNRRMRTYDPEYFVHSEHFNDISRLEIESRDNFRWVWDNYFTWDKTFGEHKITAMAGTTAEKFRGVNHGGARLDVPNNPNYWYLNLGDAGTGTNFHNGDVWTRNSYIGRASYSYKDRYLVTGTIRFDGSSKFAAGNRWATAPAIGLGWRVSEEDFLKKVDWIDNIKVRGSWGRLGNDNIASNAFRYVFNPNLGYPTGPSGDYTNGTTITAIKDPNLGWEISEEITAGVEYGFLGGRLNGEVEFYNKVTYDALINFENEAIFGGGNYLSNKAEILNRGLEIVINWSDQINKDWRYSIGTNWTFNKNEVLNLSGGNPIYSGDLLNGSRALKTDVGSPIGSFWLYNAIGVFQDQDQIDNYVDANGKKIMPNAKPGDLIYEDVNGDGVIDEEDRIMAGSYQPKVYFGFNFSLGYKQWDMSMDFYGNIGNHVYNGMRGRRFGNENITQAQVDNRWTESNRSNIHPAASNDQPLPSTYYLESGNFFRLNNITVGYTLKQSTAEKLQIGGLRMYVSAQNPWMYQEYSGFNPEMAGGTLNSGLELFAYPNSSTWLFGLNLKF